MRGLLLERYARWQWPASGGGSLGQVDTNLPCRRWDLYALGYQLPDACGSPLPGYEQSRVNVVLNRMPPRSGAVKVAYAAGSGITVHGSSTRFRHVLTNPVRDGLLGIGSLQLGALAPGDYTSCITAKDYNGNVVMVGTELPAWVD